jgi:hypothetical protein
MCAKGESVDNIKQSSATYEAKIEELENQILKFMAEKNDLEIKVEESLQDSGNWVSLGSLLNQDLWFTFSSRVEHTLFLFPCYR